MLISRWRILVLFLMAVLVLDSAGSFAARISGIGYFPIGLGAYVLYLVAGGVAGFRVGIVWGLLVGAVAAATHGSLGWLLAAWLGPDSVGEAFGNADRARLAGNAVSSGLIGAIFGGIGGLVGRILRRTQSAGPESAE